MRVHPWFAALAAVAVAASACVDAPEASDSPAPTGTSSMPGRGDNFPDFRALPEHITRLDVQAFGDSAGGVRARVWEGRAYVTTGNSTDGLAIFDVREPFQPLRLGSVGGFAPREGLGILDYGERTVVAAAPAAGGMAFIDVTDPESPRELTRLEIGSHTLGVYRPASVVYNGGWTDSELQGTEIIDATDPDDIHVDKVWNWGERGRDGTPIQPTGCHDIIVHEATAKAYCASQEQTLIWDLADPLNPVVERVVNNPGAPHHNTAFPILSGDVLVIGVELAGCGPRAGDVATPTGLWFFDLTVTPAAPLSWISVEKTDPNEPGIYGICAPHFGSEIGEGTGMLAFSWFEQGVALVDASDPRNPTIVMLDDAGGEASDAFYYGGLVWVAGEKGGLQVAVPS